MSQVDIPWRNLSEDALLGIIEEFVTREGTEYGHADVGLAAKCQQVKAQLERGEASITWDEETQTCSVVPLG